jgi:hypothetical protein
MQMKVNFDGVVMCVSSTDDGGLVEVNTRLYCTQKGSRVFLQRAI